MRDADYIISLMKTETAALGFIPSTSIRDYWIARGQYVIQRNNRGEPRGYILHGPVMPNGEMKINQAVIDFDYRLKGFGFLAVRTIIQRALNHRATHITLRCAMDLQANQFWKECGFHCTGYSPGGKQRNRMIISYRLNLPVTERSTRTTVPRTVPFSRVS